MKSVKGDLLIVRPADPEATVLRFHVDIDLPQHFGGEWEGVDAGDRSHGQAASPVSDRGRQF